MMDKEFIKIDVENLPLDILTGDYEFRCGKGISRIRNSSSIERVKYIEFMARIKDGENYSEYYYRKTEPEPPTHEEIMTRYWKISSGVWGRPYIYTSEKTKNENPVYGFIGIVDDFCYHSKNENFYFVEKSWFIGKESAETPPEA